MPCSVNLPLLLVSKTAAIDQSVCGTALSLSREYSGFFPHSMPICPLSLCRTIGMQCRYLIEFNLEKVRLSCPSFKFCAIITSSSDCTPDDVEHVRMTPCSTPPSQYTQSDLVLFLVRFRLHFSRFMFRQIVRLALRHEHPSHADEHEVPRDVQHDEHSEQDEEDVQVEVDRQGIDRTTSQDEP
mmetsp:Transcript_11281/g.31212  ORF Transcript_11281/g.31212 Transcript_11281/m.31212 type:complete len:184 (+) Transcript_11281:877-1428(+)